MLGDRGNAHALGRVRDESLSAREWRWLRTRISAAVVVGALLVGTGVALLLHNTLALRDSAGATIRNAQYLLRVVELERLVVDAETGLRGNVITGRAVFLQPLQQAQAQLPASTRELKASAAQTGVDRREVRDLLTAVHAYMSNYVPGVLALVKQNPTAARSFSVTLEGKREVDAIRRQAGRLEQQLSRSGARRAARSPSRSRCWFC
jgi:CHASE3 domain sensor protein